MICKCCFVNCFCMCYVFCMIGFAYACVCDCTAFVCLLYVGWTICVRLLYDLVYDLCMHVYVYVQFIIDLHTHIVCLLYECVQCVYVRFA